MLGLFTPMDPDEHDPTEYDDDTEPEADGGGSGMGLLRRRGVQRLIGWTILGVVPAAIIVVSLVSRWLFVSPPPPPPPRTAARYAKDVGGVVDPGHCRFGPDLAGGRTALACRCHDGRHVVGLGIDADPDTPIPWAKVDAKCGEPTTVDTWKLDPLTLTL